MFKAQIKAQSFKELLDVASKVVKETVITFSNEGIIVRAADQGHIVMLWMKYSKKIYEEFNGGPDEVALEIEKVRKALLLAKGDSVITIDYDEQDGKITLEMGNITRKIATLDKTGIVRGPESINYGGNIRIKNENAAAVEPTPVVEGQPAVESQVQEEFIPGKPVYAVIKTEDFKEGIKASASIGEQVLITMMPEGVVLDAADELDSVKVFIPIAKIVKSDIHRKAKCLYPLNYISDIVSAISGDDQINIHIWNDYPMKMEFGLASGIGKATMMLAPRVEE